MADSLGSFADLAWPLTLALAWLAGEIGHLWTGLPRISLYGLVGFACGPTQFGLLPPADTGAWVMFANVAFGLVLFEFGYRINLRWLIHNHWIGITGMVEALATFTVVYAVAVAFGSATLTALLLASLAMSTSPAALMRVVNEQRSAGQVTERVLHLAAIDCVLAVLSFKIVVGFWTYDSSGNVWLAVSNSVVLLSVSAGTGAAFGVGVPGLLYRLRRPGQDATVAFAIAVIVLVALTHTLRLSPVLAALTFGIVARHRRLALNPTQRNFGVLGDLLCVVLFVYVATTIEWQRVLTGLGLALAVIGVRLATKVACVALLARTSGISWRKGICTGLGLMPISVFVILLLEQARLLGINLIDQLAPLAAVTLLLELFGPVVTQRALQAADETREEHAASGVKPAEQPGAP